MNATRAILLIVLLAITVPTRGQAPARIAWIGPGRASDSAANLTAFTEGMRQYNLAEGKDYLLDQRYAEGRYERFPDLTNELLAHNPAVIMVVTIGSVRAAQLATRSVPIVFVSTNDPVGSGLVTNLARPEGNTTGLATQAEDLIVKFVELLREILPRAAHLAILVNPGNPSGPRLFERARSAAAPFGIRARAFEAASPDALNIAFDAIAQYRPDALLVIGDYTFFDQRDRITAFALRQRIPMFAGAPQYAAAGALITYGTSPAEMFRRAAAYVKQILAGARVADLPVEQPTKFELVVNLKTAKAIGLTIPQAMRLRADEVIQ